MCCKVVECLFVIVVVVMWYECEGVWKNVWGIVEFVIVGIGIGDCFLLYVFLVYVVVIFIL